ncbi:RNA polymerase II subunit A C-terminal domain phosphatase [Nematocida sp. LUAm3]|nr:RNA polymerase II subunit A C-terminal domain phosphatase [Nematocida sp. LUAm3]KAI5173933.1 RNA polymerase II subunit A C-terminal domain phosphatase [Nematocida sp. LUAm2]KAI5177322.1 RNA polymerase II subunit A C-terminal domain phosphatase [Nematocida sp. LUAm1]
MNDKECTHPVRMHGLCACCGKEVPIGEEKLFAALHTNANLLLNHGEAKRINEENYKRLMGEKKMVLLLDLDQTVIHTSIMKNFSFYFPKLLEYPCSSQEEEKAIRDVQHITVDGFTYYVKLRDHLRWFLMEASKYFEMHIYTMGNRAYGHKIAEILDKNKSIFGDRIVTRDDNLGCIEKDLSRLFPTNTRNVIVLDDRPDVWRFCKNLLPIRPYSFFQTGDVNSPETLQEQKEKRKKEIQESPSEEKEKHVFLSEDPKKEIIEKILEECIYSLFDNELKSVMQHLIEIHKEFFSTQEDVADILTRKKNVFGGCVARILAPCFEEERYYSSLFVYHGGAVDVYISKRTTHVVAVNGSSSFRGNSKQVKYVDSRWLLESAYCMERKDEQEFILEVEEQSSSEEREDPASEDIFESLLDGW